MEDIRKQVSEYYSNITTEKEGKMQTQICSCSDSMPLHIKKIGYVKSFVYQLLLIGCELIFF